MLPRNDELWWCALRPIDCIEKSASDELYKFCSGMSNSFGGLHSRPDDDSNSTHTNLLQDCEEPVLLQDCMWWPGACSKMFQPIKAAVDPQLEIEGQVLIPTKDLFGFADVVPESASDNGSDIKSITLPYTPDNDHCYFQPKSEQLQPQVEVVKQEPQQIYLEPEYSSDSDSSGNSGDEVDIETVTDEGQSLCALKLQRTLRNGFFRENVPPVAYNGYTRSWKTSRSRQSTYSRKRTSRSKQKRKSKTRRPRPRRPPNSLPCSPKGSSRSNSETEEPVRRNMHNNMERMRREEQRTALQHLRIQIPELKSEPKAPKVTILRKARQFISCLEKNQNEMHLLKSKLQQRHSLLLKKLKLLDKRGVYIRDYSDYVRSNL